MSLVYTAVVVSTALMLQFCAYGMQKVRAKSSFTLLNC